MTIYNEDGLEVASASEVSTGSTTFFTTLDPDFYYVTLLLHMDGADGSTTFTDVAGHTVSNFGNAQIDTAQSKFGGASALFDGTTDYLTVADAPEFNFGTGDFTVEFWMRPNSTAAPDKEVLGKRASGATYGAFLFYQSGTNLHLWMSSTGTTWNVSPGTIIKSGLVAGTWYHIALTRAGTQFRSYINGVQGSAFTSSTSLIADASPINIGATGIGELSFNGWIDEVRITKGKARYTGAGSFTPSTSPFPDAGPVQEAATATDSSSSYVSDGYWSYVTLLAHFNGADGSTSMVDEKGHTLSVFGNAQIDTAQSKFGGASALFDGTGDYITVPDSSDFAFGTGDFTIEFWMRPNVTTAPDKEIVGKRANGGTYGPWLFYQSGTNLLLFMSSTGSSWDVSPGTVIKSGLVAGTWYHLVLSRAGTQFRSYINGVQGSAFTSAASLVINTATVNIGASGDGGGAFNGWIDELRITKGKARYTGATSFTPPTAEIQDAGAYITEAVTSSESSEADFSVGSRDIVETATATETSSGDSSVGNRDVTETATATESGDAIVVYAATSTEAVAATDEQDSGNVAGVSTSETVSAIEQEDGSVSIDEGIAEGVSASESSLGFFFLYGELVDVVSATDVSSSLYILSAQLAETVSSSESASALVEYLALAAESVTALDLSVGDRQVFADKEETADAQDQVDASGLFVATLFEIITASDTYLSVLVVSANILESGAAISITSVNVEKSVTIEELVSALSTQDGLNFYGRDINEAAAAIDLHDGYVAIVIAHRKPAVLVRNKVNHAYRP